MAEIPRLSGRSDWIELAFVERDRTLSELMKLGIRLHLAGLSCSNTIRELEEFGVERSRKTIHDWVQKADLQPTDDASPDHVALDETVIRTNGQQFWLYAAVDPDTHKFLHLRLRPQHWLNTTVSARTSAETRRRRHRVSCRLRSASRGGTRPSSAPISDDPPWKSGYCRTCI